MKTNDSIEAILYRIIASGRYSQDDITDLQQLLNSSDSREVERKFNVKNIEGNNIQIGDRYFQMGWTDEAIEAFIDEQYKYLNLTEGCRDRDNLQQYLDSVLKRLKQQGCSDIRKDFTLGSRKFNYIARMTEFELASMVGVELPFGIFNRRGEAFFMFSEFYSLQMETLKQFSPLCFKWAKEQVTMSATFEAIYNGREPTHICFAIAIVDELDEETRDAIRTTNPLNTRADALWYQIPVVYELAPQQLHCYEKSPNVFEDWVGKGVWGTLRKVMREYLMPSPQEERD
ncbi:MAG: hypothetical protein SXA11_12295 [Cyanobacteriota bacterium]|nr:hypothetical protein [Cyanobacteriota bacterium]